MNLWTAIVLIVLAGSAVEVVKTYSKRSAKNSPKLEKEFEELMHTLKRQEKRIANLETILLDQHNEKKYEDLR